MHRLDYNYDHVQMLSRINMLSMKTRLESLMVVMPGVVRVDCHCIVGSAADVCELMKSDEIVSVNGAEVSGHYQESVMHVINNAIKVGQLELKIRRTIRQGGGCLSDTIVSHHRPSPCSFTSMTNTVYPEITDHHHIPSHH